MKFYDVIDVSLRISIRLQLISIGEITEEDQLEDYEDDTLFEMVKKLLPGGKAFAAGVGTDYLTQFLSLKFQWNGHFSSGIYRRICS
jgi:hypothetical protein